MKTLFQLSFMIVVLFTTFNIVQAQVSSVIRVNKSLVSDLKQAAYKYGFNCGVIVGDTIIIENNLELQDLSLVLICNNLKTSQHSITLIPYRKDSSTFDGEGKGLGGLSVSIYSNEKVRGTFDLPGGDGKPGEKGRDGRSGDKPISPDSCCSARNKGLPGRNGQDGFPGGNGGRISIFTISEDSSNIKLTGKGGRGGRGGDGGMGGTTYKEANRPSRVDLDNPAALPYKTLLEKNGNPGLAGRNGLNAIAVVKKILPNEFLKELQKYGVDSLDSAQPAFTTLINIQTPR